ncbi:MAG TPA: pyridoxal-phosphate dependent enzyme [Ignavibacteriaceae bacterium]|nr:pyridoxal-phosphate dependent enzyme [Ignavibacteriaceae bacterium]
MEIKELLNNPTTPLQKIEDEFIQNSGIELYVKRLDLTHPEISGNKWYKLKYNLVEAENKGYKKLLTFGGAFSNHIYATAAAGNLFNFETIGIIRGEEHLPLNHTLNFATSKGMKLFYLDRSSYREKTSSKALSLLKEKFGEFYLIPEGGSNQLAVKGCSEIIGEIGIPFDYICTACGTAGTLAGLSTGLNPTQKAIGFSVLKGGSFLNDNVKQLLTNFGETKNYKIITDYHFGGYAKITIELIEFINSFEKRHNIKLEPIYSAKMFHGIYDLLKNSYFKEGSKIIALHNGGLQGLEGLKDKIMFLENSRNQNSTGM